MENAELIQIIKDSPSIKLLKSRNAEFILLFMTDVFSEQTAVSSDRIHILLESRLDALGEWKDWWEFPGGKMEAGETPEEALKREIREELSTEISVDEFLCTVEYDYPAFHLTMHCYLCSLLTEALHLNEHEAARWLAKDELDSVEWLPADRDVVRGLKKSLSGV